MKKKKGRLKLASQQCIKRKRGNRRGALKDKREREIVAANYRFFLHPSNPCANSRDGERDEGGKERKRKRVSYTRGGVTQKQPM